MLTFSLTTAQQCGVLVLQLAVIIFAAKFCGDLVQKLKMPSVLGELAAGILIGPHVLGGLPIPLPGLENGLFGFLQTICLTAPDGAEIIRHVTFDGYYLSLYAIATLGSILLLFMSGLETDLQMFFRYSVVGTVVGIGGVILSYLFGAGVAMFFLHKGFMDPASMFLGILCTATSVGITARILSEKRKIDSPEGVTILAAAVIDDVLGIICLAIVMGVAGSINRSGAAAGIDWKTIGWTALKCVAVWLGATAAGLFLARYIAKFLRLFKSPTVFATLALGLALLLSGLFEQAGLAMIVGAYVMGLSLSKTDVSFAIQRALFPLYQFFVPVFFVVMGMLVDIRVFADSDTLKTGLFYTLLAVIAKIIGCALPALFMNFNWLGALRIGAGMVPRGEVALIIAGIGLSQGFLDATLFGVAIIMTLGTTVVAPPILTLFLTIKGKGVRKETADSTTVYTPFRFPSSYVADMVFQRMVETFEAEGYMMSTVDKENNVLQIRKDTLAFSMIRDETEFVFQSGAHVVSFINAIMYETFVDLHQVLTKLKDLASPVEVQKEIFETTTAPAVPAADPKKKEAERKKTAVLERSLQTSCICMDLKATTKEGVIRELLELLAANTKSIVDVEKCYTDLVEREKVITTCMQNGIALPHARTDGAENLVAAIGLKKSGYHFDSMDGEPTTVFILCVSARESGGSHIEFIAAAAAAVAKPESVKELLSKTTPEEVYAFFCPR